MKLDQFAMSRGSERALLHVVRVLVGFSDESPCYQGLLTEVYHTAFLAVGNEGPAAERGKRKHPPRKRTHSPW